MIYLLRSYTDNGSLLKLGYAKELDNRLSQYKSHNPGIKLIKLREGSRILEKKFHLYFHFLKYSAYMKEWYVDNDDIVNLFSILEEV